MSIPSIESSQSVVRFRSSIGPAVGLLGFVTAVAALSVVTHLSLLGPDPLTYPKHVSALLSTPFFVAMLVGTVVALQYEGVTLGEIGLHRTTAVSGVVAFACFWLGISVIGVVYLVATGDGGAVGFDDELPWYWILVWFLLTLTVSNGLTEELVFRGYFQNKLTALAAGRSRVPADVIGITAAALLFGVPHLPLGVILFDAGPLDVPWIILQNFIPGVLYGVLYCLTRNLLFVGLLHGFGNAPVVPFNPAAVPSFTLVTVVVGVVVGLGYRYWGRDAEHVTVSANMTTAPGE